MAAWVAGPGPRNHPSAAVSWAGCRASGFVISEAAACSPVRRKVGAFKRAYFMHDSQKCGCTYCLQTCASM